MLTTFASNNPSPIPNNGLNLLVTGVNLPAGLASIAAAPDVVQRQADQPTLSVPLVNVGQATNAITNNLAPAWPPLIQRGAPGYAVALHHQCTAQASAVFAVIYNNSTGSSGCPAGDTLCPMAATDFVPIPAVFIGQTDGQNLVNFITTNNTARARIQLTAANYAFNVTNTLVCEQVGVRLQTGLSAARQFARHTGFANGDAQRSSVFQYRYQRRSSGLDLLLNASFFREQRGHVDVVRRRSGNQDFGQCARQPA